MVEISLFDGRLCRMRLNLESTQASSKAPHTVISVWLVARGANGLVGTTSPLHHGIAITFLFHEGVMGRHGDGHFQQHISLKVRMGQIDISPPASRQFARTVGQYKERISLQSLLPLHGQIWKRVGTAEAVTVNTVAYSSVNCSTTPRHITQRPQAKS